ncbi:MAG: tRNA (adenosine(37)-N6)-threonylcarbamoyltransferase complex dimerization subunit type 1 TsaB [Gammaproteobacteria bacterium]|nr:tRNA (adenosine(37)-N6)-threonylcarbamoyltransferase complex dimerization subunit type 1 TsaB [Gammaproteobacteria bacterium]
MKILALDTSAEACSVALNLDGALMGRFQHAPRRHTELVLPMIEGLLAEAGVSLRQLDAIAFGRGPGSFTGVRIAAGVTQGIALGADLPVLAISTLAALAQRAFRQQGRRQILSAFDARMGEVYWAAYRIDQADLAVLQGREAVLAPDQVSIPEPADEPADWFGIGSGWQSYAEVLCRQTGLSGQEVGADLVCRAEELALLAEREWQQGRALSPEQALPVYLRDKVAWQKGG